MKIQTSRKNNHLNSFKRCAGVFMAFAILLNLTSFIALADKNDKIAAGQSFYDPFDNKSNWTDKLGTWLIQEESGSNNILSQTMTDTGESSTRNEMRTVITNRTWTDASYEFDVRYDGAARGDDMSSWFGVSFRKGDQDSSWRDPAGYMFYWRIDGRMDLGKGAASELMERTADLTGGPHAPDATTSGQWRHLKIVNVENNIRVFADNNPAPIYDWTDTSNHASSGYFTLNASTSAWSFDDFHIRVDGDLVRTSGFYDLETGKGSDTDGVITIPVVLFSKSVSKINLVDHEGTLVKELQGTTDYTTVSAQDRTTAYTFNNNIFSDVNEGNYIIEFVFNDDTSSNYDLFVGYDLKVADKTALVNAITEAKKQVEIEYTADSWKNLQDALDEAIRINDTYFAKQTDVDEAVQNLSEAIDHLVKRGEIVDKNGLNAAITKAEQLNENDYTALSWSRFVPILSAAQGVAGLETIKQTAVNEALRNLTIAMRNLILKPVTPTDEYTEIRYLKTNDLVNPFGIDSQRPVFSWQMRSNIVGQKQTAYQITVASNSDMSGVIWDSGKKTGDISTGIYYEGADFSDSTTYYWQVKVWDKDGKTVDSEVAKFTTALLSANAWSESFFIKPADTAPAEGSGVPVFRKEFTPDKPILSATLYSTALGNYDAFINGERVGERLDDDTMAYDELKPGYTDMGKRVQYQSYDVTRMLYGSEKNTIAAIVTNGWWNNMVNGSVWAGSDENRAFRAQLHITYTDGTSVVIPTDTTWKATYGGPVLYGDIFHGEDYDATADMSWMKNNYDESTWSAAVAQNHNVSIVAQRGQRARIRQDLELSTVSATVYEGAVGANNEKYGIINTKAIYGEGESFALKKGQTAVIDFGQNFAGWPEIEVEGNKNTKITMHHGEMLNDQQGLKSRGNDGPEGSVYLANLRGAKATGTYIMSGQNIEKYHAGYTYYGFRYLSMTAAEDITVHKVTGKVLTSIEKETGYIFTSNSSVNQLHSNSLWGQYSNYISVPSDCPQRDERQGWGADTHVFSITGAYNAEIYGFLSKWMTDMQDAQSRHKGDNAGNYGVTAPYWFNGNWRSVGWADAGIIVPYNMYKMYGDKSIIEDNYASMQQYVNTYLQSKSHPKGQGNSRDYGDWLYDSLNTTQLKEYLGTVFLAWDYSMMAEMADVLGKTTDAAQYRTWYQETKIYFNTTYVNTDGTLKISGQDASIGIQPTAYLYALKVGLLPDEASIQTNLNALVDRIENNDDKLETGFLGTSILLQTLTDFGRGDIAYKLLLQRGYPSWLFTLDQGATTFWERWDSYSIQKGFGSVGMNSFNHYSFGVVAEWMYSYMAGIMYDTNAPGFKHIILQPLTDSLNQITFVDGSYDSAYGLIQSNWEQKNDELLYSAVVPANTTATLYLPATEQAVAALKTEDVIIDGVTYLGIEMHNGIKTAKFKLLSGGYDFVVSDNSVDVSLKDEYKSSTDKYALYQGDKALTYIPATGDVRFKAQLTLPEERPVSLIFALYDRTNLTDVKLETFNSSSINANIPIVFPEERSNIKLRVFLWDSESLQPLCDSLEYLSE